VTPRLIVTVDTEEEGLWGGKYPVSGNTVRNIQQLPLFQRVCDRLGIRPTYLVAAPVVDDDRAAAVLQEFADNDRCEIGTHVHPWCNPPLADFTDSRQSYLCNLPPAMQRAKIEWLTDRIAERFGRRPTSFRAGRYGLADAGAEILSDTGYAADSSVIPFLNYTPEGGPDFSQAPWHAYRVDGELCRPAQHGGLLEVPVSVGFNRQNFRAAQSAQSFIRRSAALRRLRLEGLLDRLGLLQQIKFSPEQSTTARMNRLVDRLLEQGAPAVVMMFHSSSLLPGESPYVRTEKDLAAFLGRIEATLVDCVQRRGLSGGTLTEFAATWTGDTQLAVCSKDETN